jgi:hypothetical protein
MFHDTVGDNSILPDILPGDIARGRRGILARDYVVVGDIFSE